MERTLSADELSEILDIAPRTLRDWIRAGCPHDGEGPYRRYNEAEVLAWMRQTNRTGNPGRPHAPMSAELERAKIRKENALADRYEIQVRRERGELIDRAEEDRRGVQKIVTARNRMMMVSGKLCAQLEGMNVAERQKLIDAEMEDIVAEFARR